MNGASPGAAIEEARTTAAAEAVKADRARWRAVTMLDEAQGREALAEHLYATTEMSAAEIEATLALAPKAEAMVETGNPQVEEYERSRIVGAGLGGGWGRPTAADRWKATAERIDAHRKTFGR